MNQRTYLLGKLHDFRVKKKLVGTYSVELDSGVSALRDLSSLLDVLDNETASWSLDKTLLVGGGVVRQATSVGDAEGHFLPENTQNNIETSITER